MSKLKFQTIGDSVQLDNAVVFSLATKVWQALAGVVSVFFIGRYFSPEVQGYYYTFSSLLALQSFLELGLYIVITSVVSHEWAHLNLTSTGEIVGNTTALSRLASMASLVVKWYACISVVFIVGVGAVGSTFLSQAPSSSVSWQGAWWCVVALAGLTLWGLPLIALLEGCNQVVPLNRFRLVQAMLGNLALWVGIGLDGELWAGVFLAGVNLLCTGYFLLVHYRKFFLTLLRTSQGPSVAWWTEVWPMQWRLALPGLFNYFVSSFFTPILFHYHGARVAGQMGMTLQIVNMLQTSAMSWIQTKVPLFGMLVAQKDYEKLDRLWYRAARISVLVLVVGATVVWLFVYGLETVGNPLAQRLLGPLPLCLLLVAIILKQVVHCQAAYLRAHKKDPLFVSGMVSGIVSGLFVWWLGSRWGATGIAFGYVLVLSLITVPGTALVWVRSRRLWHTV